MIQTQTQKFTLRNIKPSDNLRLEEIIKQSLREYDMAKDGTVYTDPVIKDMHGSFAEDGAAYFVAEIDGEIVGGGGIAPLKGADKSVCELQRMFLKSTHRGKGIGYGILQRCIDFGRKQGYAFCYLETSEKLKDAIKLYERFGFIYLPEAMGNTGHFSCELKMGLKLESNNKG